MLDLENGLDLRYLWSSPVLPPVGRFLVFFEYPTGVDPQEPHPNSFLDFRRGCHKLRSFSRALENWRTSSLSPFSSTTLHQATKGGEMHGQLCAPGRKMRAPAICRWILLCMGWTLALRGIHVENTFILWQAPR